MSDFFLLTINSITLGSAYVLVALGFVLVINACGAVNFAHGDLVVLGGILAIEFVHFFTVEESIGVVVPVIFVMGVVGVLCACLVYFPLVGRPVFTVFISTIALGMILQNGMLVIVGPEPRSVPALMGLGTVVFEGMSIERQSLFILLIATVVVIGVFLLLYKTQLGRRLRATAQDYAMARACGIAVHKMILVSFILGTALAGLAGLLLGHHFFLTPTDGITFILKGYIAVAIGGWGSVFGAVFGAFLIAFFEIFVTHAFSYPVANGLLYATLLLILVLRPQGLIRETTRRRV